MTIRLPEGAQRRCDRWFGSVHHGEGETYRMAWVATPWGIVGTYEQWGADPYTSLQFVCRGACHHVSWQRQFTDRFMVTLARRFAQTVVNRD